MSEETENIVLVPEPSAKHLNPRQRVSYRDHRSKLVDWMLSEGKDPKRSIGYARSTTRQRAYRLDTLYRKTWKAENRYTENITSTHADAWMEELAETDYSQSYKHCCQKAVQTLFKWKRHEFGNSIEWEPKLSFASRSLHNPRDFLTRNERERVREAALEYRGIPDYDAITPDEREHWWRYLAQRLGKPKEDVTVDDWEATNGWKIPSLLWTTLDVGLRPIEVRRATTSWIDTTNSVVRIPKEDSAKNTDHWRCSLSDRTVIAVERWLEERNCREKYENTEQLWLTRFENPYSTGSLNRIFREICAEAGIAVEDRDLTWYSMRHSVGTYMANELTVKAAAAQLRHRSIRSTLRYDRAPIEERKAALEQME